MYLRELFLKENTALDELTHYKNLPAYKTAQDTFAGVGRSGHYDAMKKFNEFMSEHGFKKMGEGAFGAVYEKDGYPWVFKLFHGDPAYLDFLRYAIAHQHNPHVPKFKGKPFKIDDKTYAIRMEKLYEWTSYFDLMGHTKSLMHAVYSWRPPVSPEQEEVFKSRGAAGLIPVLNDLAQMCSGKNYRLDLHHGNIMRRGNTMVIVDPLVDDASLKKSEPNMAPPDESHQSTQPGGFETKSD